jgi:uncharacterized protein YhaN
MRIFSMKTILLSLAALVLVCGLSLDVSAQKKKKKKTQPLPTPVQTTPSSEPTVVGRSTDYADLEDYLPKAANAPATTGGAQTGTDIQPLSPALEDLARQVHDLTGRINSMDAKQKLLLDLEILGRAEQRAGTLRQQLMDSSDKEDTIKTRLSELEGEMTPQAIERRAAFAGSLRPEEVRDNILKTLTAEKDHLTNQMTQLQNNRAALETSLQNADALVERLRDKLEKSIEEQLQDAPAVKKPE